MLVIFRPFWLPSCETVKTLLASCVVICSLRSSSTCQRFFPSKQQRPKRQR